MEEVILSVAIDLSDKAPISASTPNFSWSNREGAGILNGLIRTYGKEAPSVEKRPGIATTDILSGGDFTLLFDVSLAVGIYIEKDGSDAKVYDTATNTLQDTLTGLGSANFYSIANASYIMVLSSSNTAYTWNGATWAQITDADFPTTNLSEGIAYLDGFFFVGTRNGTVYQSDFNNPTSWNPLNTITSERYGDRLLHVVSYLDHIVCLNSGSIEFFYNNENPTGSILKVREDLLFDYGMAPGTSKAVAIEANKLFFIGHPAKGQRFTSQTQAAAYMFDNLQLKKISSDTIDARINGRALSLQTIFATTISHFSGVLYFLTAPFTNMTVAYDCDSGVWSQWSLGGQETFPVQATTSTHLVFYDSSIALGVVDKDTYQDTGVSYEFSIITEETNFGTNKSKIIRAISVNGDTNSSGNISFSMSKDTYETYSTARTINMVSWPSLYNFGSVRNSAFKLSYSGNLPVTVKQISTYVQLQQSINQHG